MTNNINLGIFFLTIADMNHRKVLLMLETFSGKFSVVQLFGNIGLKFR